MRPSALAGRRLATAVAGLRKASELFKHSCANDSDTTSRRGPALGGVCLGKPTDLSETRGSVPIAARRSVHGMPVMAGWIELVKRYPTSYQRPSDSIVMNRERYKTIKLLPFSVPAHAEPRRDGVTAAFRSKTRRLLALPRP